MNKRILLFASALVSASILSSQAQPPMRGGRGAMAGPPAGPNFGGATAKIFGDNSAFSANMEMHSSSGSGGGEIVMPGKMAFLDGKSRFEMDLTEMKGGGMSPQQAAQMKQLGMGDIITISRPDKKVTWLVYPGLQAYVENPIQNQDDAAPASDFKINVDGVEQVRETVDGHPCVVKQVTVTDKDGKASVSRVWEATDLKNFPVKIESGEGAEKSTMIFKDIKLEKPDAAQFEVPDGLAKYGDTQTMMMQQMMNRARSTRPPGL